MKNKELYERVIDIAEKVYRGEIDPLEIDLDYFINFLKNIDVENITEDLMLLDIQALYGLALILELQSEAIKKKTQGLYLDSLLVRIKIMGMNLFQLSSLIDETLSPSLEISELNEEDLLEAKIYFERFVKLKWVPPNKPSYVVKEFKYITDEDLESKIKFLLNELINISKYEWIDYNSFISKGDKILRAYLLSFLVSDGYVDMRVDRLSNRIYIKPLKFRKKYKKPASIPVVLINEEI